MKVQLLLLSFIFACFMSTGCKSGRELVYFKDIDSNPELLESKYKDYAVKVIKGDELLITVTSEVPEATVQYNLPQVDYSRKGDTEATPQAKLMSYIVDADGYISFPVLGKLKVEGMTTSEISDMLVEKISKDVKNPYVRVQMPRYRVNVLGEVNNPGAKSVSTERYSILDAISDAGDLSQYGRRDNVLLIREVDGNRTYHRLDLGSAEILKSPYFYLQQNDVIYVEPNDIRKSNAEYDQNKSYKVQVASVVVSTISVIASLVIALAVK